MFSDAYSFNQDISAWNISAGTNFRRMFDDCESFDQDLCAWGDKIQSNATVPFMFDDAVKCESESDPDLGANPKGPFCYECQ